MTAHSQAAIQLLRASASAAGQPAPSSLDEIVDLDVELLQAAGRSHDAVVAGRQLPSLARLRGWGFVVDVQAVRQEDLLQQAVQPAEARLTRMITALRTCTQGEGEPPLELLLVAVACAASGAVLRVPVQQLREGDLVELDLSDRGIDVGGGRLLALLLPAIKLVRLK